MPSTKEQVVDAIIIGGGLAGMHLALMMDRAGLDVAVIDRPDPSCASRIAAGIINPITGRRFALSWLYDHLSPVFKEVYRYWEEQWHDRFFFSRNIYRSVPHNKLVNDLDAKLSDPAYKIHCRSMTSVEIQSASGMVDFVEPGYVMHGYQLDTVRFLENAKAHFKSKNRFVEAPFQPIAEVLGKRSFSYEGFESDRLILANGAAVARETPFQWVRMKPNKGEVAIVHIPECSNTDIIKQSAYYIPMADEKWWIGTFDTWEMDQSPTSPGLEYLQEKTNVIKPAHRIIDHLAAIRPAVEDRRPVIGAHPENDHLYLFNGFGSKGTSLIPFFAKMFVEHIKHDLPIMAEVDVRRFWPVT